jgi:predicted peptidase
MKKLFTLLAFTAAMAVAHGQTSEVPFTVISKVGEAGPRVVAVSVDFGKTLPINWKLEKAFSVNAELQPVKSYAGHLIANSAVAKAPRTIKRAYTSAKPEMGSPSQGRYVIIEMDQDDINAASWYPGFNPSIRQMISYKDNIKYEISLLHDLNVVSPNISPTQPGSAVELLKAGVTFKQADSRIQTVEKFTQGVFRIPENPQTKFIGYNFYKPSDLSSNVKVPLVVFLHGSGQSHDYTHFPNDETADVLSPLLANQGGVTWVERGPEKVYVLVPQAPARDTRDPAGEWGWRGADTQKLLLGLIDKIVAENPNIDTNRLYLTGLSMGAIGSWKIITNSDPKISKKFAAAALFNGIPTGGLFPISDETPQQRDARVLNEVKAVPYRNVSIPVWITHADTDPVVSRIGSRVPFALLVDQGEVDASGELVPSKGTLKKSNAHERRYEGVGKTHKNAIRYTEYPFGNGDQFHELGMVTRNGHFSWEISYKDQEIINWMFAQKKR